ncbi:unnamed protein product [Bemisia tabaci]|uniref:Uncharacterized protein n=1 Tax=Bemisia tabaci TaxID=7038 RepID=A0A9P0EW24_BEMTA|nr:unnamed protein product [Bemisia tabaci]
MTLTTAGAGRGRKRPGAWPGACEHPAHLCLVCATSEDGSDRGWDPEPELARPSQERMLGEHNYEAATDVDNNLTWGFTQPPSSHLRQLSQIQQSIQGTRDSGWNYANPLGRYVELCAEDTSRCSTDVQDVLEKYFTVTSVTNNLPTQKKVTARRIAKEPIKIEEKIFKTAKVGSDQKEGFSHGENTLKPEKKVSLLGIHLLRDKKMFLLQTSNSIRKTATERYQNISKAFRLPGKMASNLRFGNSCRRMSCFPNEECRADTIGRRNNYVVSQGIPRMSQLVLARVCEAPDQ